MQHDAQPTRHQLSTRIPRGPPGARAGAPIVVAPGCSTQGCVGTTSGAPPEVAGKPLRKTSRAFGVQSFSMPRIKTSPGGGNVAIEMTGGVIVDARGTVVTF